MTSVPIRPLLALLLPCAFAAALPAQNAAYDGAAYAENFNAMGPGGTTPPAGWTLWSGAGAANTWNDSNGIRSGVTASAGGVGAMTLSTAPLSTTNNPTANANNGYNAGAPGDAADRLLATPCTGLAGLALQLSVVNNSGAPLSAVSLAYEIRRYNSSPGPNELPGYRVFHSLDAGATWTALPGLDPALSGPASVLVPNSAGLTTVSPTPIRLSSPWQPGAALLLRWVDDNADGYSPDQIIGLDDVAVSPAAAEPPLVSLDSPLDGAVVANDVPLVLSATASAPGGSLARVEFYDGAAKLGEDASAPYSFAISPLAAGAHLYSARAVDAAGRVTASPAAVVNAFVPAPPELVAIWAGQLRHDAATVVAMLNTAGASARLAVSTAADFSSPVFFGPLVSGASKTLRFEAAGLAPATTYHYAVEFAGALQTGAGKTGRFRTAPAPGPASFRFAMSSCGDWRIAGGQYVYDTIRNLEPDALFFLHMGDLNYLDTNSTDPEAYRANYRNALTLSPQQGALFRFLPVVYMWDDHDFSGNDSNKTSAGRSAHRLAYREMAPHYPLPAGGPDATIQQAFTIGRVRFIVTDLRSERDPPGWADNATKSMMGAAQKAWFKAELLAARDAEAPLIVWNSSVPFLSTETNNDNWGNYQTERLELLTFIRDQRIRNLMIVSGDMHGLAYDSGVGTAAYLPGVSIPVFHAAALAQDSSYKGGPYDGGASPGMTRYGTIDITDTGGLLQVAYAGKIAADATAVTVWKSHSFTTQPVLPRAPRDLVATPAAGRIDLAWTDASGVETVHRVERSADEGATWQTLGTSAANTSVYADTGVEPGAAYLYRVLALNGALASDPSGVAAATAHTAYMSWAETRLGDASASPLADPDHDSLSNLLEYALDTDPAAASSPGPDAGLVEGRLSLTFVRHRAELIYAVLASDDLVNWQIIATNPGAVGESVTVRDNAAPEARRFLRLRVEAGQSVPSPL